MQKKKRIEEEGPVTIDKRWLREALPKSLPRHWEKTADEFGPYVVGFVKVSATMSGIVSGIQLLVMIRGRVEGGKHMLDFIVEADRRQANFDELMEVKRVFLGAERACVLTIPPESQQKENAYRLHMMHVLEAGIISEESSIIITG